MNEFLHHTARLESVLKDGRDRSGKVDAARLNRTQRAQVATILCESFTEILSKDLVPKLLAEVRTHYEKNHTKFTQGQIDSALLYLGKFLEFEAKLFESKQVPRVVAEETFGSITDLQLGLTRFLNEADFRDELLDPAPWIVGLTRAKDVICSAENAENTELLLEKRFILGGFAVSALNTAADLALAAVVLFTVMSTGGGLYVAWRRLNW